jgi:hypothetical protein
LLLSGFDAVSTSRTQQPLDQLGIKSIDNAGTGVLAIHVVAVRNAGAYEVQGKADGDAAYKTYGLFRSTRGMQASGLTSGVNYTFQVRAVGGSTGYSQWSDPGSPPEPVKKVRSSESSRIPARVPRAAKHAEGAPCCKRGGFLSSTRVML